MQESVAQLECAERTPGHSAVVDRVEDTKEGVTVYPNIGKGTRLRVACAHFPFRSLFNESRFGLHQRGTLHVVSSLQRLCLDMMDKFCVRAGKLSSSRGILGREYVQAS